MAKQPGYCVASFQCGYKRQRIDELEKLLAEAREYVDMDADDEGPMLTHDLLARIDAALTSRSEVEA